MQFISLEHAFSQDFIKSLPHLTWLKLTANEKLIIELVLSFKRKGLDFYMNHAAIAEYLVLSNTKTKAKSVGNIIGRLKKKGYIETVTTHNYNGKNGGSSTTIAINDAFLEAQLHAVFNPVEELHQNTMQAIPVLAFEQNNLHGQNLTLSTATAVEIQMADKTHEVESDEDFIAFMQTDSDEPRAIPDLSRLAKSDNVVDEMEDEDREELNELAAVADGINDLAMFKFFLQELLSRRFMTSRKERLQWIIENQNGYGLEKMKGAFEALILK